MNQERRGSRPSRRRLALLPVLCALLSPAGCAQMQAPPGGPPDNKAPELLRILPDTGAVNATPPRVVFQFNEVVSERPQGATTLDGLFLISPYDGEPQVDWRRSVITVRPKRGFRKNTVYVVTLLPGLVDLRGNSRKDGAQAIFSTGPTIPNTTIAGIVFDWPAGRPASRPFVEAISLPDSVVYVTVGDSLGGFALPYLPPGRYALRATIDQNNNRRRDPRELYDSIDVALTDTVTRELLAFVHDTIGPRINTVTIRDSLTLRVEFDKPVDPRQTLGVPLFTLRAADSSTVTIAAVATVAEFERLDSARTRARTDSMARRDSAARADSARRAPAGGGAGARADTGRRPAPVTDAGIAGRRVAAAPPGRNPSGVRPSAELRDSAAAAAADVPKPSRPSPIREFVLSLGAPLRPNTGYRLQAARIRGLLGNERTSERAFTTPKPPPPPSADSASGPRGAPAGAARPPAAPPAVPPRRP